MKQAFLYEKNIPYCHVFDVCSFIFYHFSFIQFKSYIDLWMKLLQRPFFNILGHSIVTNLCYDQLSVLNLELVIWSRYFCSSYCEIIRLRCGTFFQSWFLDLILLLVFWLKIIFWMVFLEVFVNWLWQKDLRRIFVMPINQVWSLSLWRILRTWCVSMFTVVSKNIQSILWKLTIHKLTE